MDSLAWSKTFPVFAISRLFLRDELGFTTEQVQRLTDDDLVRIADYVEQFYRGMSHFEEHVSFITTLVLSQVQPTEQEIQRCDACDTWVATHEVAVGEQIYYVCDKPKCQDAIEALSDIAKESKMPDWTKQFCVTSINRADLTEFGLTDEQIEALFSDEVMRQIAGEMQGFYHLQQPFWQDLAQAIKTVLGLEVQTQGGQS